MDPLERVLPKFDFRERHSRFIECPPETAVARVMQTEAAPDRYVLVEFWATRRVRPLPDLILVEDFGNGLGLYRRPS